MHVIVTCKYEKERMKDIRRKVATPFFPLKPYGSYLLPCKNQSSNAIWPKALCTQSSIHMILRIKFDCDPPAGLRDIVERRTVEHMD